MPTTGLLCANCRNRSGVVTPLNGGTILAKMSQGDVVVALHTRCEQAWAEKNDCQSLVPLKGVNASRGTAN